MSKIKSIYQILFGLIFIVSPVFISNCNGKQPTAKIIERGVIDIYEKELKNKDGDTYHCETSAVVYAGGLLIFGMDDKFPITPQNRRSSVFYIEYSNFPKEPDGFYTAEPFIDAEKYEDFTITPDDRYVIATTAFDRIDPDGTSKWDGFNTLLIWPVGSPQEVKIISPSTNNGITSSVGLRKKISSALPTNQYTKGVPYFKIEGIAAVPENKLLLGIRGLGEKHTNFNYAFKIISVSYSIENDELAFTDDFKLIYDYDVYKEEKKLGQIVGLSSIEYDKYHKRLYILTSYEKEDNNNTDEDLGGYLWVLPMDDLYSKNDPELVLNIDNDKPLHFAHKCEAITVINKEILIVVHDDDKVTGRKDVVNPEIQFSRQHNQMAYTTVKIVK